MTARFRKRNNTRQLAPTPFVGGHGSKACLLLSFTPVCPLFKVILHHMVSGLNDGSSIRSYNVEIIKKESVAKQETKVEGIFTTRW
ncbi:hypothetical protein QVD17_09942 [Tagetes erecta]|uniref:Uncharacterized protein n=1 Tax=Tagetes erecta TaxID=13708 RepID=A0AAD8P5R6_TARER|nr:hypothetical protein QVD17_09942 [Tagetes erecta]